MPGVPTGRGCEGCRKQKKKCDQQRPTCSRCARLNLPCVGSGQRRFIFKPHEQPRNNSETEQIEKEPAAYQYELIFNEISAVPCNKQSRLVGAYGQTIAPSTDMRFNLMWHFGGYMREIPQRIGLNESLDAAVEVLTSAHADVCGGGVVITTRTLILYNRALQALRRCLDDPAKACEVETLCAVTLLLNCQAFLGGDETSETPHCEGAAQILKARGYYNPNDKFETMLLLALRGPVLFEGIFNSNIYFTPSEWKVLVENVLDGASYEGKMLQCLAKVPEFMRRGRHMFSKKCMQDLQDDIRLQYNNMKTIVAKLHAALKRLSRPATSELKVVPGAAATYVLTQRGYGIGLYIAIVLNRMLVAIGGEDDETLQDSTNFSREILSIAEQSHIYRPLGSGFVILCLAAGLVAATDITTKILLLNQMTDYKQDYPWGRDKASVETLDGPDCTGFEKIKMLQRSFEKLSANDPDETTEYKFTLSDFHNQPG